MLYSYNEYEEHRKSKFILLEHVSNVFFAFIDNYSPLK
jgi:hypothetical protein